MEVEILHSNVVGFFEGLSRDLRHFNFNDLQIESFQSVNQLFQKPLDRAIIKAFLLNEYNGKIKILEEMNEQDPEALVVPIFNGDDIFILPIHWDLEDRLKFFLLMEHLTFFFSFSHSKEIQEKIPDAIDPDDSTFHPINSEQFYYPMVLLGSDQEVILYNQKFMDLGLFPKQFSTQTDPVRIIYHEGVDIECCCSDFEFEDKRLKFFIFRKVSTDQSETPKYSPKELGIMTSSIAHELNNPMAGILSALSVLQMDQWEDEEAEILNNLIDVAKRCTKLIHIFLGFSRSNVSTEGQSNLTEVLFMAVEMLRYRSAELNLKIELLELEDSKPHPRNTGQSILVIIFYLILSEFLTKMSQQKMINNQLGGSRSFSIKFIESIQGIQLIFSESEWDLKNFHHQIKNKLVLHLLEISQLSYRPLENRPILELLNYGY